MYNNKYQEGHKNALPFNLISIVCYIGDSMIIIRSRMLPHTTACANCELPEYKELCKRYDEEEKKLEQYREECKNKAFDLFSKWFCSLWG